MYVNILPMIVQCLKGFPTMHVAFLIVHCDISEITDLLWFGTLMYSNAHTLLLMASKTKRRFY